MEALEQLAEALRRRLIARARDGEGAGGASLVEDVRELVDTEVPALPEDERAALCARVVRLATGLGPLEPLLADPAVDEVMVNGPGDVYVERAGRIERTGLSFGSEADLMHSIERVLAPLGRRVDEASPLCDARLPDGSRVNVVIAPLALTAAALLGACSSQEQPSARTGADSSTSAAAGWPPRSRATTRRMYSAAEIPSAAARSRTRRCSSGGNEICIRTIMMSPSYPGRPDFRQARQSTTLGGWINRPARRHSASAGAL